MAKRLTVLITGCTEGGIGHSLALSFSRQNYHVFATSRRLSSMKSLSDNENITLLELDVTSVASIQSAYELVSKVTGGTLDILYHNAGFRSIVMGMHSDWALAERTFRTNFFGIVELTRVFMPLILDAGKGSKIIFSNSVAAVVPIPTTVVYGASKAALDMYAKVLEMELEPLGIIVVNVMTGEVATKMAESFMENLPEGSLYQPIEITINAAWKTRGAIMPVEQYAEQVVKMVSQRSPPPRIWLGANSTLVWLIDFLGLQWIYPIMFRREYGFNNLSAGIKELSNLTSKQK